ncbi:MAG: O-antigen ligase family protein [Coriobacteriia bacterium]|nr:O-antigen ligase family protein [Coriobacteriia bacterium]
MTAGREGAARRPAPYAYVVAACLLVSLFIGMLTPIMPAMAVALVVIGALAAAAFSQPLIAVALLLAIGGMPLEQLTGGEKSLLQGFGGASASGIVLVAMVGLLSIMLLNSKAFSRISFLDGAFGLLLIAGAASILWAPAPLEGFRVLSKMAYPFLIYLAVRSLMSGERQRDLVVRLVLLGGVIVSVWAFYGFVTVGLPAFIHGGVYNLTVSTTHPTPFGFYNVCLFALCYARWRQHGSRGFAAFAVLFGIEAVMSQSRMAMFGVVLVAVLVELALSRRPTRWLQAALVAALLVVVGGVTILSVPRLQEGVFYTPQSLRSTPAEILASLNDQGRGNVATAMVRDLVNDRALVFGEGLGSSTVELQQGTLGDLGGVGVAHNEYVRLLYETGVLGLTLAVVAFAALVLSAWKISQRIPDDHRWLGAAAFGLSVCYVVFCVTDNVLDYYNTFSQFVFFALGASLAMEASHARGASEAEGRTRGFDGAALSARGAES